MNMDESIVEKMVGVVPENWFDTPEITTWLAFRDFPFNSVENMVAYVRAHFQIPVAFRLIDEKFPQSYAHWWCHCRMAVIQNKKAVAVYPKLQKWCDILGVKKGNSSPYKIFGTIEGYLDMLTFDIVLFPDEKQRENIPRIDMNNNFIMKHTKKALQTRKKTKEYLIEEGASIFKERGWNDGYKYWLQKCQKYKL